eukprot:6184357-Pleurochrysis_carterae.AAC.1
MRTLRRLDVACGMNGSLRLLVRGGLVCGSACVAFVFVLMRRLAPCAQVACAAYHSLALSADGEVWAWGSARYGLLGLDDVDALPADPDDEQAAPDDRPHRHTHTRD